MNLPPHFPPKGRIQPSKSPPIFLKTMTLVNDFQNIIAASKPNYNHPNPAEKDKTCVSSQINFDILIRRPNLTIPYQIFPIMIPIFDMCTAREDCSDFFLILVQDFFYLQLEAPLTQLSFVRKLPFHHFIAMFLG